MTAAGQAATGLALFQLVIYTALPFSFVKNPWLINFLIAVPNYVTPEQTAFFIRHITEQLSVYLSELKTFLNNWFYLAQTLNSDALPDPQGSTMTPAALVNETADGPARELERGIKTVKILLIVRTQRPEDRDMAVAYFLSNGHKRERDRCPKRQPSDNQWPWATAAIVPLRTDLASSHPRYTASIMRSSHPSTQPLAGPGARQRRVNESCSEENSLQIWAYNPRGELWAKGGIPPEESDPESENAGSGDDYGPNGAVSDDE
ncbi:hypothetical protein B0H14DRAFT_3165715 [Mycena olivaceomarginata]|nr:hypothetical protein B0H14DRAFT_3165715 [Mycena olivaceomarginata]